MAELPYRRRDAVSYAQKWAFSRNPHYFNFDGVGGDCTNFASQCIFAGSGVMNYTRDTGWYYSSPWDRAAAWSGVDYLYRFLTGNRGPGPYAAEAEEGALFPGDIIQLRNAAGIWYHTLLVTGKNQEDLFVSAHTFDAFNRAFSSYTSYSQARFLHIAGIRK